MFDTTVDTSIGMVRSFLIKDSTMFKLTVAATDGGSHQHQYDFFVRASDDCSAVAPAVTILGPSGDRVPLRSVCDSSEELLRHEPPLQQAGVMTVRSPGVYRVTSISGLWARPHLGIIGEAVGVGILAILGVYCTIYFAGLLAVAGVVVLCCAGLCQCLDKGEPLMGDSSDGGDYD
eukprot:CAMPEP_0204583436 /NCGR_PEP_ID=MMETSP0661-20131031/45773_1 /ASSEMBLY_ACC=CAM_ASM_000606 /TAXON_ID=109239 /ORGANISM="Alexandrium margalefi, Strain AMGDE01CS-322" /LENGTH=175 /DNA_ID=CAMNT_0051592787 /DNA_START=144 /DNA_END=669 /DNA_ORIENTATION=+